MGTKRQLEEAEGDLATRKLAKRKSSDPVVNGWTISQGVGGQILNLDPLFSEDGDYIMVAYPQSIRVFSTKSSLLRRVLAVCHGQITGLSRSSQSAPEEIILSTDQGVLERWDWTTGVQISRHSVSKYIKSMAVVQDLVDDTCDAVVTVEKTVTNADQTTNFPPSDSDSVYIHLINRHTDQIESKTVCDAVNIQNLRVLDHGKIIIISSTDRLVIVSSSTDLSTKTLDTFSYDRYELELHEKITCLDARLQKSTASSHDLDIALGNIRGQIDVYSNVISNLKRISKKSQIQRPNVRKLHWHRYPVKTVNFSRDGNYLISGGLETVLYRWQLETGQGSALPHLRAPIERLAVSPDGASYAVVFGNNSLIILSTLDLQPTFALPGISWPSQKSGKNPSQVFPAFVKPESIPGQLLLAAPWSTAEALGHSVSSAVCLQTIDVRTGAELELQALTRSNVTEKLSDPYGRVIREPNISHMSIDQSGTWLATVESWTPDSQSLDGAAVLPEDSDSAVANRAEVFLKFWRRDETSKAWQLSFRIENPHRASPSKASSILDLVTLPDGFATVGSDGEIKIWHPKNLKRYNIQARNSSGVPLTSWRCMRSITAPSAPIVEGYSDTIETAQLAASSDGSLLALAVIYRSSSIICMIDVEQGTVSMVKDDVRLSSLHGMAVVDRYLVLLSDNLLVWDLVNDQIQFSYSLKSSTLPKHRRHGFSHLAANQSGYFAIAVPDANASKTQLAIFAPSSSEPVALHQLPQTVRGIYPASSSDGFIFIDGQLQIRSIVSPNSVQTISNEDQTRASPDELEETSRLPLRSLEALTRGTEDNFELNGPAMAIDSETEISQAKLAEIFDAVKPAGRDTLKAMFERVAALALGRPASTRV